MIQFQKMLMRMLAPYCRPSFVLPSASIQHRFYSSTTQQKIHSPHDAISLGNKLLEGQSTDAKKKSATELMQAFQTRFAPTFEPSTGAEMLTLIELPIAFDYQDPNYWKELNRIVKKYCVSMSLEEKISMLYILRTAGHTDQEIFAAVTEQLLFVADKMSPDELLQTAIAYCYYPKKESTWTKQLDESLAERIGAIPPSDFCVLLDELAYSGLNLPTFLDTGKDYVFKKRDQFPRAGFCGVISAYTRFMPDKCKDTLRLLEDEIFNHFAAFTTKEVVDLLSLFSQREDYGSEELFSEFERFLGENLARIRTEEFAPALAAFARRKRRHEKFFLVCQRRIKALVAEFSAGDMARIVESYSKMDSKEPELYDLLEPYIIKKRKELAPKEILAVVYGYSNQNLRFKFKVYDRLEQQILENLDRYTVGEVVKLMYGYMLTKKGTKKFNAELLETVKRKSEEMDPETLVRFLAITVRKRMSKDICDLTETQVLRQADKFSFDELDEITFFTDKADEGHYEKLKARIAEMIAKANSKSGGHVGGMNK